MIKIALFFLLVINNTQWILCETEPSFLDNFIVPFRLFRASFVNALLQSNRQARRFFKTEQDPKVQKVIAENVPFPCSTNGTRSAEKPKSVHQLRPGDIDVIGAIGDSLTAGYGLTATQFVEILIEERGKSFSIGGEKTWRHYFTIPNILKNFNPNLVGYSLKTSLSLERASQFNVAEGGAISSNTPYMTKVLISRIKHDKRVDFANDWKLITMLIGANDFCSEMCYHDDKERLLLKHEADLKQVFGLLRDFLPRTIVNLIPVPNLKIFAEAKLPPYCYPRQKLLCPCLFGLVHENQRTFYYDFMRKWQEIDVKIAHSPEFDTDTFTVVSQPFSINYQLPILEDGTSDFSLFARDCFHISQKGDARFANDLWNNMLEPVDCKSSNGNDFLAKFNCPTVNNPYIFTRRNGKC